MKKKVIASILALMLAVQPCSMVSAAEVTFTDGTQKAVEVRSEEESSQLEEAFQDGDSTVPEETEPFASETTLSVGEEDTQEERVQIGDDVWVTFEGDIATISGTGEMWDFLEDGETLVGGHKNPFNENISVDTIIVMDGVTHISDYLLYKEIGNLYYSFGIKEVVLGKDVASIGKYAFHCENSLESINFPDNLKSIGDYCFWECRKLTELTLPDSITGLGNHCFEGCSNINTVKLSNSLEEIPTGCFYKCSSLTYIDIPENVIKIGDAAFYQCTGLITVNLPNTLTTIEDNSFYGCSRLININLPESLIKIGGYAFSVCSRLNNVIIPNHIESLSYNAFADCINLSNIVLSENLKNIQFQVFQDCVRLQEITIPASVTQIEDTAFEGCENLNLIKGYTGSTAEQYANDHNIPFESLGDMPSTSPILTGISMEWTSHNSARITCVSNKDGWYYVGWVIRGSEPPIFDSEQDGVAITANREFVIDLYDLEADNPIDVYVRVKDTDGTLSKNLLFQLNESQRPEEPVNKIQVGDNVFATVEGDTLTISGSGATYDRDWTGHWFHGDKTQITKVKFEGNINYIGHYFFYGFDSIKEIELPEGITGLGEAVFCQCDGLEKITFPSTLLEIPIIAFCWDFEESLTNLKTVIISEGVEKLGADAFKGCTALEMIKLPNSLNEIGDNAFNNCISLTEIILPEGLTQLGNDAFSECNALEKIVFPSTLKEIPVFASYWDGKLPNLKEVIISEGVEKIGDDAFADIKSLESITFPNSLIEVGDFAFSRTGLKSLSLPDNIENVGDGAFQSCTNLQSITIPEKCINWGDSVFYAAAVESITWNAENPIIPSGIFAGCANLKDVTIPEGVTAIDNAAFSGCTSLTNVSIPKSVTELGESTFEGCSSLQKISIPETVKYFGNDVFYNCRNLTIYGYRDSMAERYANNNNIPFVSADYKVVFKNNGRTVKTEYVLEGNDATPPTLDPREGYTLSWDGDYTNIQEDMIINAVWTKSDDSGDDEPPIIVYPPEETKYTVTFVDRGKVIKTEKVVSGEAADYPYIYRYGYSLEWDKDFSKVTSDMTVNAVWTVITPEKVTSLTAEILPKSIRLSWDENEYTNYFLVYRKASNETEYTQVGRTAKVLWTDKKAKNGTEYQYKVIAVHAVSGKKYQSADSDIVTAKLGSVEKGKIYSVGKLNYKVMNTKEVQVTGLAKLTGTVVVPSTVTIAGNVFKVTSIADKAFMQNTDIINVRIGNNITQIGQQAFYKCANLETVNLGSNVLYLRNGSFARCTSLKSINIPKSVKRIGIRAFYHCSNLNLVTVKTTRLEYIGKKAMEISPKTVIKVPEAKYRQYKKMIIKSGKYAGTKIEKY